MSAVLEARSDLHVEGSLLYNAVYTLFSAMPSRLVAGTTMYIATLDVPGGVELSWECREEPQYGIAAGSHARSDGEGGKGGLREILTQGPHGDLSEIAFSALEQFCGLRAGECVTERMVIPASPHFPRGDALLRRVRAFLPVSREQGLASVEAWRERKADRAPTDVARV